MSSLNCQCKYSCAGVAFVAGIIIGIIAFVLAFTATIAVTPAFLWVLLGIAVVYLPVLLIFAATVGYGEGSRCLCSTLNVLLGGILGTILIAIILLAISFAATSIVGAIFIGLLLFFFTLIIVGTACLVKCAAGCSGDGD